MIMQDTQCEHKLTPVLEHAAYGSKWPKVGRRFGTVVDQVEGGRKMTQDNQYELQRMGRLLQSLRLI
jgi:hypothetical protein